MIRKKIMLNWIHLLWLIINAFIVLGVYNSFIESSVLSKALIYNLSTPLALFVGIATIMLVKEELKASFMFSLIAYPLTAMLDCLPLLGLCLINALKPFLDWYFKPFKNATIILDSICFGTMLFCGFMMLASIFSFVLAFMLSPDPIEIENKENKKSID